MNTVKTTVLMVTLTLFLVWAGAFFGGQGGMAIALLFALGINFFGYWYSDKIVLKMHGAREINRSEAPELYNMVERLARKGDIPMPRLYLIDEEQPNAFATGRNPEHGVVAVTTGLMRILSREELEGVVAHELAHIKNRDILISTMAAAIAGAISFLAQMAQWAAIFGGRNNEEEGGNPIAALVMMIVGPIAAMVIQMAISRSREYGADATGGEISGNPRALASALRKLQMGAERVPMDAGPATSHLFIVNPLSGGSLANLFSTHPPMEERIARLEGQAGLRAA